VSNVLPAATNSQPAESFSFGLTVGATAACRAAEPSPAATVGCKSVQKRSSIVCATSVPTTTPAGGSQQQIAGEPVSVHFGRFAPLMNMPSQLTGLTAAAATPAGPSGGSFSFPDVSQVSLDSSSHGCCCMQ
jgi:hypothetical protein